MFGWFRESHETTSPGLDRMRAEFGQMLDGGRSIFDTATNALLGGTDLEVIRQGLFATEKRINKAERQIRRELVVHASVHGPNEFPACLVLMSIVKDAERIGDYGKNIFDVAELSPHVPTGQWREDMIRLKDRISRALAECREVFDSRDAEQAARLIVACQEIEDECDRQVHGLIKQELEADLPVSYALVYRYFKRVTSHAGNVTTSIIQPIHKLDFVKEKDLAPYLETSEGS